MAENGFNVFLLLGLLAIYFISDSGAVSLDREKRSDDEWSVTTLVVSINPLWTTVTINIAEKPYVMKTKDPATSNEDYKGYIPDILKKIGEKLNQKYKIHEVSDGKYGTLERGQWNGMIGEVIQNRATLAAAPITITTTRQEAVDFTEPFMSFGTVILMLKPTNSSVPEPKNVHDLLQQPGLRFGVVRDGSTENNIRSSTDADISRMQERLEQVSTQELGVKKVRESHGKFAFVIEEFTAKYWKRQTPCELTTIPVTQMGKKDYALVLKKGSPHTAKVKQALNELKSSGELTTLEEKWWDGPCSAGSSLTPVTWTLVGVLGALRFLVKF